MTPTLVSPQHFSSFLDFQHLTLNVSLLGPVIIMIYSAVSFSSSSHVNLSISSRIFFFRTTTYSTPALWNGVHNCHSFNCHTQLLSSSAFLSHQPVFLVAVRHLLISNACLNFKGLMDPELATRAPNPDDWAVYSIHCEYWTHAVKTPAGKSPKRAHPASPSALQRWS